MMDLTLTRPRKARSARWGRSGFTLVEILIVVVIITLLLAIAVPNFIKACESSHSHSCIANLKQIEEAKAQWAMDHPAPATGVAPADTDLYGPNGYIRHTPVCPSGGTYKIGDLSTPPACSIGTARTPAHAIP
jgi:prepilin-type N-terminal cleavage/methylation domain-containing protein